MRAPGILLKEHIYALCVFRYVYNTRKLTAGKPSQSGYFNWIDFVMDL